MRSDNRYPFAVVGVYHVASAGIAVRRSKFPSHRAGSEVHAALVRKFLNFAGTIDPNHPQGGCTSTNPDFSQAVKNRIRDPISGKNFKIVTVERR